MLPYTKGRGREAYKRIKCHVSIPENLKEHKMIKSKRGKKGLSLKRLSILLGGKT